jgi:hypothetical protein
MEKVIYNPNTTQGRYYKDGLCIRCGDARDSIRLMCASCRDKSAEQKKITKRLRIAQSLCPLCAVPSLPNSQLCRNCFFYNVANKTLKNVKIAQAIATLFDEQGGRCAYTGETLVLGVNTSIDHKTPQCRGGGHNIENLQWVSKRINGNKYNLTHEEFVAECANIAAKFL